MICEQNEKKNRLIGNLPKIGIRPTIDGRRKGIRESVEEKTMNMAKAVKALYESTLRHSCGLPVECVIADTTIGGVAEAAACAEKFKREGVGFTLTVTPVWCYGSETMDMDETCPKAIWGFNGTERPGAVYLAAVLAAHNQKGLPAFSIYGHDVQDVDDNTIPEDVQEKLLRFARAGLAVAQMRGKSYLSMGSVAMGIAGSMVDASFLESYLGMRAESIDMSEFIRRMQEGIFDQEEYALALAWAKENVQIGEDLCNKDRTHDQATKERALETSIKMAIIARDLMVGNEKLQQMGFVEESCGHNAIAAGFQGQRQWTDFMPNGDFMEALLNSSFDWNGIREPHVVATENDMGNGISMLFGKLLTNTAQGFADVRTYWSPAAVERVTGWKPEGLAKDGFIHLINSGAACLDATGACKRDGKPVMLPWWQLKAEDAEAMMRSTRFSYGNLGYFRGGGYSSTFLTEGGMPMTMTRLNFVKGLGPVLQVAEGYSVALPEQVCKTLWDRTDPTWPCTWFAPRLTGKGAFTDVYSVMANWGANHGAFCYGHIGADMLTLASMLRIPVSMHNVDESKIFRPSAWNAFGTMDRESADFRACQNFGPLYKRY